VIDVQDKRKAKQIHHTVQIQEAAERLFAEKGFHLTTVEEIAREANLGKGTIYLHFANKKDLFLSVIERQLKILLQHIESGIVQEATGMSKLRRAIGIHLAFLQRNANFFKIFQTFPEQFKKELEEELLQRVIAVNAQYLDLLERIVRQGIEEGDIRDMNPRKLAAMLVGVIHSLTIYWAYGDRGDSLSADEILAWEFFRHGTATRRSRTGVSAATTSKS
jgi:TetR/AcrR family fatty acid metabolism transcriptional regulator